MENLLFYIEPEKTLAFFGDRAERFVVRPSLIDGIYVAEHLRLHYREFVKLKNLPNPGGMYDDIPVYEKIYNRC